MPARRGAGRKRKPTKLTLLEGNPGKRKPREGEPDPPPFLPDPPSHLDARALAEWHRLAPGLCALGILAEMDRAILAGYCTAYSRHCAAEDELGKLRAKAEISALVQKTTAGDWKQNPLVGISDSAALSMLRFATEFGMGAAARAKLGIVPGKKEKSKFDGLISLPGGKK